MTNMKDESHPLVMKELSDIKSSLAVNTTETQNIKNSITEIKNDMKDIKLDFVNRREFNDGLNAVRGEINSMHEEFSPLKKIIYTLVGIILLGVLGAILNMVIIK